MCRFVSHVSPSAFRKSSLMFVFQCFVSVAFVPLPSLASLPSPPLPLCLAVSHNQVHKHVQHPAHMCMHAHTYTAGLSSIWLSDLFISCGFFAPSFSAFNSPSYPPLLALSITDHDLTRQNLASNLFLPECKYWNVINLFF